MHLIESYATNCGLKIDEPFIYEKFFPLSSEKYITFSTSAEQAKDYDYWIEVLNLLLPKFKENNISILQLGDRGLRPLPYCLSAVGLTNRNQEAYLIRNGLLHLGVDNFLSQLAGSYNRKQVCLYGNSYSKDVRPYWGVDRNTTILESHRNGKKPSFSSVENPKTINLILPEDVAKAVCELLNLDFDYKYKTVEFGGNYPNRIIETLPNQVVDIKSMNLDSIIVRMDYFFNEENLIKQLQLGKASIVTDKPINEQIIQQFKGSIKEVVYFVRKDHDPKFVSTLKKCAVRFMMMTDLPPEELEKIKIHYMDHGIIYPVIKQQTGHLRNKALYYLSSKITLSNSKMYPSKAALSLDKPLENQYDVSEVVDTEEFWEDASHCYFLEKIL